MNEETPRTYDKWFLKYRRLLGCENPYRICWCKVCANLSKAWLEAMDIAAECGRESWKK